MEMGKRKDYVMPNKFESPAVQKLFNVSFGASKKIV